MNVWLDLMATPNNQLGTFEQYGNTVTPETARNVIKHIAKKYDPRVLPFSRKLITLGCNDNPCSSRHYLSKYTIKPPSSRPKVHKENQE